MKTLARRLLIGLAAGAAGTAAMTAAQRLEMRMSGRPPSKTPARAAERVLDVEPADEGQEQRLGRAVHWAYGTALGGVRGLLGGPSLARSGGAFFLITWLLGLFLPPSLGVASPPTRWGGRALAKDALHHAIYAGATSLAYRRLSRRGL